MKYQFQRYLLNINYILLKINTVINMTEEYLIIYKYTKSQYTKNYGFINRSINYFKELTIVSYMINKFLKGCRYISLPPRF